LQFFVAEKLGMTLADLRQKMSVKELYGWNAYFDLKAEQEEKAYEDAKRQAQVSKVR
tara:strand:+ start:931 stop:1101 length:171 start_codon:yes stop_codon:yes gene_type:complete